MIREILAKAFNGKCGESIYRSETAMTLEDAQEEVQSGIDHLLADLKSHGLTIEADWNTDMESAHDYALESGNAVLLRSKTRVMVCEARSCVHQPWSTIPGAWSFAAPTAWRPITPPQEVEG